jgi:hypothetical protein
MTRARSRLVLLAVLVGGVAAALAGAAWYVLGEERRLGRVVTGYLAGQTGLLISVERARVDGHRLTLSGVSLRPSPSVPVDVKLSRLDVDGGLLPLVLPAGGTVVMTASSVSISIERGGAGGVPDARVLDALRASARSWLGRGGTLALRVPDGEVRLAGRSYRFELTGDKSPAGALTLALRVAPAPGTTPPSTLGVRVAADGETDVAVRIEATGEPGRLGVPWPAAAPAVVAASSDARLIAGGELAATGRIALGSAPERAALTFSARYDGRTTGLVVERLGLEGPPGVSLRGSGSIAPDAGTLRVSAEVTGTIDGSPLSLRGVYRPDSRALDVDLSLSGVNIDRLKARTPLSFQDTGIRAGALHARIRSAAGGGLDLGVRAERVEAAVAPGFVVDGALTAKVAVLRVVQGGAVGRLDDAALRVTRGGVSVVTVTGRSRGAGLWPIEVEAVASDVGPLALAFAKDAELSGAARFAGEVSQGERLGVVGRARLEVPRAVGRGGAVVASGLRADVPVAWHASPTGADGEVSLDRLTAWGFQASAVRSSARFTDGRLLLPDVRAAHHGGRAEGWMEAAVDGRAVPVRSHLEGDRIDLAAIVRESGSDMARITGRVGYVLNAQYTPDGGLAATADFASQEEGEVAIEPIQQLLLSSAVQVESSGLLRQTLENLRVFEYESLQGSVRVRGGSGRADLALRGKKRLWIFPGPVEAINLKNVPLDLLVRTLEKGSSP